MSLSPRKAGVGERKETYHVNDTVGDAGVEARDLVVEDRGAFDDWLRDWFRNTRYETIADVAARGGGAYVWVRVAGKWCCLDADTTRAGVFQYFQHTRLAGSALDWHVVSDRRGRGNRVGVGPCKRALRGFHLHTEDHHSDSFQLA